ncbi:MAG: aminopeptidase N, partial [Proteobacteria bacterium]|nr:aminopeptidase N [Pseudomonadota bacterium]
MPSRLFAPLILMLLLANPCLLNAAANSLLRQSEAQLRKKQLDDIHYQLSLELPETDTPFSGQLTIDFKFHAQGQPLRLDFSQGEVLSASIQAKPVKFSYDGSAIYFDEKDLQSGVSNQVVVTYKHAYSKDGNGLYWFKDPVDAQVYTYTHFEPYEANKFFPCFDQPDLKATYQLTVKAPKSWTVVSASRETKILEAGEARIWSFPPSLSFSTYLISMHAGPYKVWEDSHYRIPLRIMARQSMAEFMPVEEWFAATRHGFDFFDKYLGYAYPFGKYDQVAVPDFNAGAMENVAAVTFSERFLVRGLRTKADVQGLAGTILHEMAHMWFGDLVTMQWWNDLWLNESFATYASTLAMAADKRFPDTWLGFYRSKIGAYFADQLVSTHPIVSEVFDTDSTSFDGITYGKGAAFLKQLNFYLGDEDFQKGLQIYFKQHAFKNTQLKDFIAAMERASRKDLQHFAEEWLQTAGLNTLSAKITCDKKRIKSFFLEQTAQPGQAILREHKTKVALYKLNRGHLELIKESSVRYEGPLTAWPGAIGLACPDLVLPNQGDFDYVKVKLDRPSFQLASEHLQDLKQPMQRMMLWSAAADSLLDAEISLGDFSQFVARHLRVEKNYEVLRSIEARLSRDYLPYLQWIPDEALRNKLITEISGVYRGQMQSPDLNADIKKLSFEPYLNLLTMHKNTQEILDIFQGKL